MHIESTTQTYLGNEIRCAHIVADEVCTWRFEKVLDVDGAYSWQFVIKADSEKTVTVLCGDQEQAFSVNDAFQHLTKVFHDVTIGDHPHVDVEFPVGEYYIGRTQLEHGTIVTDWQISMDDTASEVSKMWSSITQTKEEIRAEVRADYMVHNLVPTEYSRYQASGKTWKPSNGTVGIKWITNDDGSVKVELLSGYTQTTAQSAYAVTNYTLGGTASPIQLDPLKRYTISGCPSGGSNTSYFLRVRLYTASDTPSDSITFVDDENQFYDFGEGLTLETGWQWMTVHLVVASGYELPAEGITFWPMVIEGETLKPYTPASKGDVSIWSTIQQTANKISLVVGGDNVVDGASIVAAINNQTLESSVSISADKIGISGETINLSTKNLSIKAFDGGDEILSLTPTGGTIAGWTINKRRLEQMVTIGSETYRSGMQSRNPDSSTSEWNAAFYAGCTTQPGGTIVDNASFYVRHNGEMFCQKSILGSEKSTLGPFAYEAYTDVLDLIEHDTATSSDVAQYDIDQDGELTTTDVTLLYRAQLNNESLSDNIITRSATLTINPSNDGKVIKLTRTYEFTNAESITDEPLSMGIYGLKTTGYVNASRFLINGSRLGAVTYFGNEVSSPISIASGSWTDVLNNNGSVAYRFTKGIYLVTYTVLFQNNATGLRKALISSYTSGHNTGNADKLNTLDVKTAVSGDYTILKIVHLYTFGRDALPTEDEPDHDKFFEVYQNSGSALNAWYRLYISKIA